MTYRYSSKFTLLFLFLALVFPFVWLGFSYINFKPHELRFDALMEIPFVVIELMILGLYVHAKTFVFSIDGDVVTTGAVLGRTSFRISDQTCARIVERQGNVDGALILWNKKKRVAKVDFLIEDYQELLALLKSKIEASGGEFKQSTRRKEEQMRLERDAAASLNRSTTKGAFKPNHIPVGERITSLIFAVLLFMYGSYGVWVNDVYIPGKRSRGIHLHDVPAWIMYGAMLCACVVMLSVVADHYDKRDNETNYRLVSTVSKYLGWILFVLSLLISAIHLRMA